MEFLVNHPDFDIQRFAEALERNAQEAVKWERRKLEWILEDQKKSTEREQEAA